MANTDNIRGVKSIEIGNPGDGVVGVGLTPYDSKTVVLNSLSLDGGDATETNIPTEGDDNYLTVGTGSTPATSTFRLLEIKGDKAVQLMGGTYDDETKEWGAPTQKPDIYLSVVITDLNDNKIIFPYAKITAKLAGNISKGELLSVEVKVTANTPVSSGGLTGSPYIIKIATPLEEV